ncbi:MAG: PKD domain-containing protein [Thermoanaerobaculales bacterium]
MRSRTRLVVSILFVLGGAASMGAADNADRIRMMRQWATTVGQAEASVANVAPLAVTGFARAYGGSKADEAYFVRQVGSNYVFEGTTDSFGLGMLNPWLTELDGNGNLILQQVWGTAQTVAGIVNPTPDGGYAISLASQTNPFVLIKLNSSFASVWQKQYGNGGEGLVSAVVLGDNSFLIEGTSIHTSGMGLSFVDTVIKTDSSGNIVWQKQFSSSAPITLAFGQLADGSFISVGTIALGSSYSNINILVVKLDSGGNISWQKSYGGPAQDYAFSALSISGGYLISGLTTSFGAGKSDVVLLQLDSSGNLAKQETIGGPGDDFGFLQPLGGGGYVLSGSTDSPPAAGTDGWLAFLGSSLNVTSSKIYGGPGNESLFALPDSAGGFLLEGSTSSFGGGGQNTWLVKSDGSGTPIWQNAYGGPANDSLVATRLSGGGLMLSGSTNSWGAGGSDMLAALLDANGQLAGGLGASADAWDTTEPAVAGCGLVHPTTVTPVNFPVTVTPTNITPATTTLTVTNGTITTSAISLSPITTTATVTDICNAPAALAATASANTTSGAAPLSVNFTGSAAGGTSPYGFDWNFGDGSAHSSQQNPTHLYGSAGSYNVVLKVTDATTATATDSHLTINVSSGTCTVTCTASVPGTGTVGVAVSFTSSASASNCGGAVSYLWNFGDGQTSTAQNPTHTYGQAQTYSWTLVVTSGTGSCNKNGSLTISAAGAQQTWVVVGSHASGLNNSQYRSDLGLLNAGSGSKNVEIQGFIGGSMFTKNVVVAAGEQLILTDVVGQLGASGSGAIEVTSDPVKVTARTYNQVSSTASCYPNGTQGQDYLAATTSQGLSAGQSAWLGQLTESAAYRTNIGLTNTSNGNVSATVYLYDATGHLLGSYQVSLGPGGFQQVTQPFKNKATPSQTAMAAGYAKITVNSGSGVLAYASVLDNITNDPTTINPLAADSGTDVWIPVGSHASGLNNSQYRSDLGLLNTGAASASVQIKGYIGGSVFTKNVVVAAGAQLILTDVVGQQLAASGSGAIEVISNHPLKVTARTYNQVSSTASCYPNGTQGQDYLAATTSQGLSVGQTAWLGQLTESAAYRTNIGLTNTSNGNVSATVYLYDATGHLLGSYQVSLGPGQFQQVTQPFKNKATPSQTAMAAGYAKITVNSGSGVLAYASVLDNITNDPTTINPVL